MLKFLNLPRKVFLACTRFDRVRTGVSEIAPGRNIYGISGHTMRIVAFEFCSRCLSEFQRKAFGNMSRSGRGSAERLSKRPKQIAGL